MLILRRVVSSLPILSLKSHLHEHQREYHMDVANGRNETTLSVNAFTAPGKTMVGERPKPFGEQFGFDPITSTLLFGSPHGAKLTPHRHPEDRVYTVISGVFYIGLGEQVDADKLQAYPPGSVIVLPGNTPHFHWAKSGEYVTQITALGPLGLEYLDAKDDPRNNRS